MTLSLKSWQHYCTWIILILDLDLDMPAYTVDSHESELPGTAKKNRSCIYTEVSVIHRVITIWLRGTKSMVHSDCVFILSIEFISVVYYGASAWTLRSVHTNRNFILNMFALMGIHCIDDEEIISNMSVPSKSWLHGASNTCNN